MCTNSTTIATSLRFVSNKSQPRVRCSSALPVITSQIAGLSYALHALPVQLKVLRVIATLEDVGNATVPETAPEDRIMRIQLQEHDVQLATTFIAVWTLASLNLRATGRQRESTENKRWQ